MSVLIETSLGELVVDLYTEDCPVTCKNFLKLCKIKYYNHCLFHNVQKNFIVQTGDPTGTGKGGDSIFKFLYGDQARFFDDEIKPTLKHKKVGTVAMASAGPNLNASQFYITTREDLDYLDEKHTVFGEIAEGFDCLMRINEAFVDEKNKPLKNIRIKHTYILDDPFPDPDELLPIIPETSPERKPELEGDEIRLEDDWVPMDEGKAPEEVDNMLKEKESKSRAVVLEMIGDLPEADFRPPENVLFVCKLNPITQDEDLEIIFSRFGKVVSADIIRDSKTGDSLCYAFIEFENKEDCEAAYLKMENVLIDDRRIHVDFSQSVGKLWSRFKKFGKRDKKVDEDHERKELKSVKCFKCGGYGHISKNCREEKEVERKNRDTKKSDDELEDEIGKDENEKGKSSAKYELKPMNANFGKPSKSYDLIFDAPGSPKPQDKEKRRDYEDRRRGEEKREFSKKRRDEDRGRRDDEFYRHGHRSREDKERHRHQKFKNGNGVEASERSRVRREEERYEHRYRNNERDWDRERDRREKREYRGEEREETRARNGREETGSGNKRAWRDSGEDREADGRRKKER